jgi:hypothetical protein
MSPTFPALAQSSGPNVPALQPCALTALRSGVAHPRLAFGATTMSLVKSLASTADGKPIERMNRSTRRDTSPRVLIAHVAALRCPTATATAAPTAAAAAAASLRRTTRFFDDDFFVLDFFAAVFFVVGFFVFDVFVLLFFVLLFFADDFFPEDFVAVDFFVAILLSSAYERRKMGNPYAS